MVGADHGGTEARCEADCETDLGRDETDQALGQRCAIAVVGILDGLSLGQLLDERLAHGRCSERLAGTEAYLPFLEALESLLRGEDGEAVARLMKVIAPTWYAQVVPLAAEDSSFARVLEQAKAVSQ